MKVKNISGQSLSLAGIGIVKADQTVDVPDGFHNANFIQISPKEIKVKKVSKKIETKVEKKLKKITNKNI